MCEKESESQSEIESESARCSRSRECTPSWLQVQAEEVEGGVGGLSASLREGQWEGGRHTRYGKCPDASIAGPGAWGLARHMGGRQT